MLQNTIIEMAIAESKKSNVSTKHGAIIEGYNGKIYRGYNHSISIDKSYHAEGDVIIKYLRERNLLHISRWILLRFI